jgi:hypothetical protein
MGENLIGARYQLWRSLHVIDGHNLAQLGKNIVNIAEHRDIYVGDRYSRTSVSQGLQTPDS